MSKTPRTDAARQDEHDPYMAVAAECAKMEKELTECDDLIRRLNDVVYDPHALWANWLRGDVKLPEGIGDVREYKDRIKRLEEENNELRAEESRLLNTNGELERRIKRLEDLGSKLRECARQLGWTSSDDSRWIERAEAVVEAWDKEAKL